MSTTRTARNVKGIGNGTVCAMAHAMRKFRKRMGDPGVDAKFVSLVEGTRLRATIERLETLREMARTGLADVKVQPGREYVGELDGMMALLADADAGQPGTYDASRKAAAKARAAKIVPQMSDDAIIAIIAAAYVRLDAVTVDAVTVAPCADCRRVRVSKFGGPDAVCRAHKS